MQQSEEDKRIFTLDLGFIALCFLIGLAGFGYILTTLPEIAKPPSDLPRVCITGGWKYGLVLTHALTFVLIPLAMRIFYEGLKNLKAPSKSIFASQLGLAFIMVAIASEMGWHVTQCWYYTNDFTMLNFMFYFFLISAFALWAGGLVEQETILTRIFNGVFALGLLAASILYSLGFANNNNDSYKIPIYILLTLVFTIITYRGYKLLGTWKIILVPLFSVGVNLSFIVLLDKYGGDPYTDPQVALNALFHILHDLMGTEVGVAIFTWLIYDIGIAKIKTEKQTV